MDSPQVFRDESLRGASFEGVDLQGASFRLTDLSGARLHNVFMPGARLTGVVLENVLIDGDIRGLVVNGVEVEPLVEAELDRRHADRALMRPTDPDGYRAAWDRLEELWGGTVERALSLEARSPGVVHERVDGEWSFVETLRHLVFVTDVWLTRALLGEPAPYHPLGLPHEESASDPAVPWDREARPTLEEVLEARRDRWGRVATVLRDLTDERLAGVTTPVEAPGYPPPAAYPVSRCLRAVVGEEWEHRLFAERDLGVLESRLDG
jgi:hypothetical protein